ncbi:MAG: hypothetical protein HY606_04635 [Planctomycetes bacterium]|nr:hypothetical protein [Planctomycetota bacterium]
MYKQKICMIPQFHYDVVYCDTFEGYLIRSFANLIEMLNLMDKYPDYKFLIEQVILIKEFWDRFPEHRTRLRQLAKDRRIELSPGMYLVPDMNLISGESLIRQIEIGKKWIKDKLGLEPRTCWIADCWGHHGQLPQILKKCGYEYYVFSRAMRMDITDRSEFYWQGLDGTRILTHWIPIGYDGFTFHGFTYKPRAEEILEYKTDGLSCQEFDLKRLSNQLEILSKHATGKTILIPDGTDFGRPQLDGPNVLNEWNRRYPDRPIKFSLASDTLHAFENQKDNIPIVTADFNPAFQGTYASRIDIKQNNRFLENHIETAEKLLSCLQIERIDNLYFEYELNNVVTLMLYNQFHDIICGSIIDEAYQDTVNKYQEAIGSIQKIIISRLDKLFSSDEKSSDKVGLMAFNPLCREREDIIHGRISFSKDEVEDIKITNQKGEVIPVQIIDKKTVLRNDIPHNTEFSIIFGSSLPALGYKGYNIELVTKRQSYPNSFFIKNNILENKFYKLQLSNSGVIKNLIHKGSGLEFVDQNRPYFNDLVFQTDQGDFWEYYEAPVNGGLRTTRIYSDPYPLNNNVRGREAVFAHQRPHEIEVVEKGPVRLTVRVKGKISFWANTWGYIQYIYLYNNIQRIDFRTELIPTGRHYRVRVCFPTNIEDGKIRYEIPFGIQERPEGEYPALNWIDYSDNSKGICLINKGLPGNNVTDRVMMLSLFRAIDMGPRKHKSETGYAEGKKQVFEYSLVPFSVDDDNYHPALYGKEVNLPVITRVGNIGKKLIEKSFFKLYPDNVIISKIERLKEGVLIRIYESEGKETEYNLQLPIQLSHIYQTNCLKENYVPIENDGDNIKGFINPFELKTFWLELGKGLKMKGTSGTRRD